MMGQAKRVALTVVGAGLLMGAGISLFVAFFGDTSECMVNPYCQGAMYLVVGLATAAAVAGVKSIHAGAR
jgi:hypothetical protein